MKGDAAQKEDLQFSLRFKQVAQCSKIMDIQHTEAGGTSVKYLVLKQR